MNIVSTVGQPDSPITKARVLGLLDAFNSTMGELSSVTSSLERRLTPILARQSENIDQESAPVGTQLVLVSDRLEAYGAQLSIQLCRINQIIARLGI